MQVLVLNQDYQAISICEPERALVLVWMDKAEMVADVAERKLRSVRTEFAFPSVIRLRSYVQLPFRKVSLTRENIFRRDGYTCGYCGSTKDLTLDHIVPKSQGGGFTWKNLVTACRPCNVEKGDQSLEEYGKSLRHKPFRPSFIMYMSQFHGQVDINWRPFLYMS
ncbi:HNH endonuclease [Pontibacter sp. G13]|uniref:HNH endonuclease n=1 Tax=Pontibacter sp. G13 TaxID=3074898 RepID=UPI00288A7561|nr:HNH endonuclease [Pontibacter sp. G13]WNJ20683.1 HNH endonuclease [Pontibacter sp. G13]